MSIRIRSELLAIVAMLLALGAARPARADDGALERQRERFKTGMEKYAAGNYAEAIVIWEAVYREIGETTGYRLAFNLARAFDKYGDSTRAAEHYEVYVREVERRRALGEALDPQVEKWESEAKERLEELATTKGRIRVLVGDRPVAVRIDAGEPRLSGFVAYVDPGRHSVTFGTGKDAQKIDIDVGEGKETELAPPSPPPPVIETPIPSPPPARPAPTRFTTRTERPFSPTFLWIAGGATALSVIVPIVTYSNVSAIRADYIGANDRGDPNASNLASDFDSARSLAYATLAIPIVLAAATAGLATWYVLGAPEKTVRSARGPAGIAGAF